MTQFLLVLSMRTIRATLWTRWQNTMRFAMASLCCRHCKACTCRFPPCWLVFLFVEFCWTINRLATLHGEEDAGGLLRLLDPQTLAGRAVCISLLTPGSGLLSLAPSAPVSPMNDSPISFGWNRKLYRYSVPATPRYSGPPTPIA